MGMVICPAMHIWPKTSWLGFSVLMVDLISQLFISGDKVAFGHFAGDDVP